MTNGLLKKDKGFTIIEVVLVLAIAGLIFLIVFLALPQLQRSRRDTQRKSDAGRLLSALESYSGNTNGSYPTDATAVTTNVVGAYLTNNGGVFSDPDTGVTYTIVDITTSSTTAVSAAGQIGFETNAQCTATPSPADALDVGAGARSIAIVIFQESGGVYCQDNR